MHVTCCTYNAQGMPCMQVLVHLHAALQAVALNDPLLRVSVGLRLALHLQAAATPVAAATVLQQVTECQRHTATARVHT